MYKLYCCGSRGSRPVEGRRFNEFGGFTSCYILKTDDYALIIDCGTGFYEANHIVSDCSKVDIVLTHVHYDHILGMLDWTAIPKTSIVNFYANFDGWFGEDTMVEFFRKPFWPVQPDFKIHQCPPDGVPLELRDNLSIEFYNAPHPNGAKLLVIRHKNIEYRKGKPFVVNPDNERRVVVMFDCEKSDGLPEELLKNCDILLYDGMYTDEEYPSRIGYGHSTWEEGCKLANKINCERLVITHHSPDRDDDTLRNFEAQARMMFPNTDFARSGQIWDLNPDIKKKVYSPLEENNSSDDDVASRIIKKNQKPNLYTRLSNIIVDEPKMRRFMSLSIYLVLCLISAGMSALNFVQEYYALMYSTIIFAGCTLLDFLLARFIPSIEKGISILFQMEFIALFTFFIVTGTPGGFSLVWLFLLPTMGMLVFGRKACTIDCAIMLVILIFAFWTDTGRDIIRTCAIDKVTVNYPPSSPSTKLDTTGIPYTTATLFRFPIGFLAFTIVGYIMETVRSYAYKKLSQLRSELKDRVADQTSELRDQNFELTRVNSQLGLRNRLLNNTFGRFMPEQVVDELLENPNIVELEGKKMNVTTIQCDVRGFTKLVKDMNPLDAVGMLNHYFSEITDIIQKYNGTILDFVGDAVFAVFGAPLESVCQADDAIDAAIALQKSMVRINEWNEANFYPHMTIGIGIHTGEAILGTVGSARHLKYDAIGNDINVCSRIEATAKSGQILVSETTMAIAKNKYDIVESHETKIKGVDKNIVLHEIKYQQEEQKK